MAAPAAAPRLAGAWQGGVQVRQRVNYWRWRILKEATDPTAKMANMATKTATKIVKIPGKSPKAGKTAKLSPPGSAIDPPTDWRADGRETSLKPCRQATGEKVVCACVRVGAQCNPLTGFSLFGRGVFVTVLAYLATVAATVARWPD